MYRRVCFYFNNDLGCRKGSDCKFKHIYKKCIDGDICANLRCTMSHPTYRKFYPENRSWLDEVNDRDRNEYFDAKKRNGVLSRLKSVDFGAPTTKLASPRSPRGRLGPPSVPNYSTYDPYDNGIEHGEHNFEMETHHNNRYDPYDDGVGNEKYTHKKYRYKSVEISKRTKDVRTGYDHSLYWPQNKKLDDMSNMEYKNNNKNRLYTLNLRDESSAGKFPLEYVTTIWSSKRAQDSLVNLILNNKTMDLSLDD